MTILSKQYLELDAKDRARFRTKLLNISTDRPLILARSLKIQSLESLEKLKQSLNIFIAHECNPPKGLTTSDIHHFRFILEEVEFVISKRLADVPVDVKTIHLDFHPNIFQVSDNINEPYIDIYYDLMLKPIILQIFSSYLYTDKEIATWGISPDKLYLSKMSIAGKEAEIAFQFQEALVLAKFQILNTLIERLQNQQPLRLLSLGPITDPTLQSALLDSERQIEKLVQLAQNPDVMLTPKEITDEILETNTIYFTIKYLNPPEESIERQSIFRRSPPKLATEETSSIAQKTSDSQWASFEIKNLVEIIPRSNYPFVILNISSESKHVAQVIQQIFSSCQSNHPLTWITRFEENQMFINDELLRQQTDIVEHVKAGLLANQEPIVAELKELVEFSKQACCSDERLKKSTTILLIKQQGKNLFDRLSQITTPETLIQAICETHTYVTNAKMAIKIFEQTHNTPRIRI